MRTRCFAISAAILLGLAAAGCSSSAKPAATTTVPTTIAEDGPSDTSCPFSGSTSSQSEPGGAGPTELNSATATPSGCIDNVTFGFSPSLAPSVTVYETPAPAGGAVLVITMKNATLGGSLKPGTTVDPQNLNYVSKVVLTSSSGAVVWNVTLDKQRPFLVSSSKVPAELVIAVG